MATTLTTSYQKIGTINLTYDKVYIYAKYNKQDKVTNKTAYSLKTTYYRSEGSLSTSSATSKLDGTTKTFGYTTFQKGETTLQEVSRTLTHNQDGSSPTKNITASLSMAYGGSGSKTVEIKMPSIKRLATVTSANDFTDEENPTIEFDNPAGFNVYPYLNFYDEEGTKVYGLSRKSSSATSPYTWDITNEERTNLREATNKQQSYKVTVGVDTYDGATSLGYNSKPQIMTYVNAEPIQATVFTETNPKVIDVLGSSNADTIIQNVSQLKLVSTPTVKKGATVSKVTFEHNNLSTDDTTSPYEHPFIPVNSKFKVTINDSRKYSVPTEYVKNIIEYAPIEISSHSFKRQSPTSSNVVVNAQIKYVQATFGSKNNVPTIKWKLNENGTLNTLTSSDYTIDSTNNKIKISNLVLENVLDYKNPGEFYLYVNDLLTEDKENAYPVPKGIPTCDMGEYDFKVNGELYVADVNGQNKVNMLEQINFLKTKQVLWNGAYYMHDTQQIDLSETPISKQPNGIVLLFSAYEDETAQNYNWCSFFIPKTFCELHNGNGMLFPMFTTAFGTVGNKYIYIYNDMLKGHADNTKTGTGGSGIIYKNNSWVLRYVIGI